jgi:hypothetical protein
VNSWELAFCSAAPGAGVRHVGKAIPIWYSDRESCDSAQPGCSWNFIPRNCAIPTPNVRWIWRIRYRGNYTGISSAAGRISLSTFLWEGYETAVFRPGMVESRQWRAKTWRGSSHCRGTACRAPAFAIYVTPRRRTVQRGDSRYCAAKTRSALPGVPDVNTYPEPTKTMPPATVGPGAAIEPPLAGT